MLTVSWLVPVTLLVTYCVLLLQIIKTAPGITCVSGAMLLLTHAPEYGKNGILVMGDVAVTPVPDANQLAQIAICTAQTAKPLPVLKIRKWLC